MTSKGRFAATRRRQPSAPPAHRQLRLRPSAPQALQRLFAEKTSCLIIAQPADSAQHAEIARTNIRRVPGALNLTISWPRSRTCHSISDRSNGSGFALLRQMGETLIECLPTFAAARFVAGTRRPRRGAGTHFAAGQPPVAASGRQALTTPLAASLPALRPIAGSGSPHISCARAGGRASATPEALRLRHCEATKSGLQGVDSRTRRCAGKNAMLSPGRPAG